ncbi:MAG: hypothetical protein AAGB11_19225 [Pseudomonadota bacterium]
MKKTVGLAAAMIIVAAPVLAEEAPIANITGEWTGKGFVQKGEDSRKINVNCKIDGEQTGDEIEFGGDCRAMLVMKREIGAQLTREGDIYTGTYKGSELGIADLEGSFENPDELVLQMRFPRKVNGDDLARMTIQTMNEDEFRITTVDMTEAGNEFTTSEITFQREESVAER